MRSVREIEYRIDRLNDILMDLEVELLIAKANEKLIRLGSKINFQYREDFYGIQYYEDEAEEATFCIVWNDKEIYINWLDELIEVGYDYHDINNTLEDNLLWDMKTILKEKFRKSLNN